MSSKSADFKNQISFLTRSHEDILKKISELDLALTNLRYEGKVSFGKNLSRLEYILELLNKKLLPHIEIEDLVLSFLKVHVPKTQVIVNVLQLEHKELMENMEGLETLRRKLRFERTESRRVQTIDRLKFRGTYLIYLLRHHIQIEDESIFQMAEEELHPEEKSRLLNRIKQYLDKN